MKNNHARGSREKFSLLHLRGNATYNKTQKKSKWKINKIIHIPQYMINNERTKKNKKKERENEGKGYIILNSKKPARKFLE